jgi:outer membrane protein assembly factor BamB
MIKLKDFDNAEAPSGVYPYGAIKDDDGTLNGTELNRKMFNDAYQFLAKMFAESSIISNGLPDNATNGFQLFDSFFSYHKKLNGWFNERISADDISVNLTTGMFIITPNIVFPVGAIFACRVNEPEVTAFNLSTGLAVGSYTAELVSPFKCFVVAPGSENLYILDYNHPTHRILQFSMDDGLNVADKIALNATASNVRDLFIVNDRFYVLTQSDGVKVYNFASNAYIPSEDFGSGDFTDGTSLFISHGKAYISDRNLGKIFVYDIASQTNLTNEHIGLGLLSDPKGIFIIGNKIYVSDENAKIKAFDISSKANLAADFIDTNITDPIALHYDKMNNRMFVYDVTSSKILVFKQNLTIDHI